MSERRRYSAEKKAEILREHFKNKMTITEVCSKYGITPSLFYRWEKQLFEGALEIFSGTHIKQANGGKSANEKKLEEKLHKKEEVISWLTEENLKLKKNLGEA